jgi:hypothetical protein
MSNNQQLTIIINGKPVLEYDRGKPVPAHQQQYLDNMDQRMDQGIVVADESIADPNPLQRTQFVASSMVNALLEENDTLAIAMCTYLGKRMPELQQVKAIQKEETGLSIELVFDRSYEKAQQEQTISFNPAL